MPCSTLMLAFTFKLAFVRLQKKVINKLIQILDIAKISIIS